MQEKPRDLFNRVFGVSSSSEQDANEKRIRQSVLDSVLEQYRCFTSVNSPLGSASKSKIKDHLDRVREYEGEPSAPDLQTKEFKYLHLQITSMAAQLTQEEKE